MLSILEKCIITITEYNKYCRMKFVTLYLSHFLVVSEIYLIFPYDLFFSLWDAFWTSPTFCPLSVLSLKRDNHPSTRCVWHGGPLEWSGENLSFSYFRVDRASFHRGPPVREKNRDGWVSRLVSWWKSTGGWWENGGDCSSGDARCEDKYWSDTHGREDKTCDIKPLRLRDVFPMCD